MSGHLTTAGSWWSWTWDPGLPTACARSLVPRWEATLWRMEPHPYLPPPSPPSLGDGEACGLSSHFLHLQPRGTSLSRAEGGHRESHCRAGGRHKTSSLSCRNA